MVAAVVGKSADSVGQLSIFGALDESLLYHDPRAFGFFALLTKRKESDTKDQRSYKLIEMPQVISLLDKSRDAWLSQAEFVKPSRMLVNLARIGLLFVDIDCYKNGYTHTQALAAVMCVCQEVGLPPPSVSIYSGRGLQIKWLLDGTIPRWQLPRWNLVQSYLVDLFKPWGGDPAARDASRVLRIVDTVNTKSGEIVAVLDATLGEDGMPERHSFEFLAEFILPLAVELPTCDKKSTNHTVSAAEQVCIAKARERREAKGKLKVFEGGRTQSHQRFGARQLSWHRAEDIRTLTRIRGGVQIGQGMVTLFWTLNFLALSGAITSARFYAEASQICQEYGFGVLTRNDELKTLYSKVLDFEAGKKVTFGGREWPPLYTPRNATLIDIFQITPAEQKLLRTIIGKDEARERGRQQDLKRRRDRGQVDRSIYLSKNNDKRSLALSMRTEGKSQREISVALGVDRTTLYRWLKRDVAG